MSSENDVVEWHTWSGTRHKFGPEVSRTAWPYRRSLCGGGHYADEKTQRQAKERRRCKRCFPVDEPQEINRLAALIREVDGSHNLGAGDLAEALHRRGVRVAVSSGASA